VVSWSPCHDIWWMSSTTGLRFERRTLVSDVHILIYIYIYYIYIFFYLYIHINIVCPWFVVPADFRSRV
jgi:hypothetical protein